MKFDRRSLLALAVAGGLIAVPMNMGVATASPSIISIRLDDEHYEHFEHMHRALNRLREARDELSSAEDIFKGHREEALDHVNHAIHEVEDGLREQGENIDKTVLSPSTIKLDDDEKYPHLRHALNKLHEAREQLDQADAIFHDHRQKAIDETDHAIHQIDDAINHG
jgi:ElaB/YqjD/DUF883 family membrane-anchored ribosome-binding protein